MKAHEVLTAAAKVLRDFGWCQGANARDANGKDVPVADPGGSRRPNPEAARFSIYGAIMRAGLTGDRQTQTGPMWDVLVREAVDRRRDGTPITSRQHQVFEYNDREGMTIEGALDFLEACADRMKPVDETTKATESPSPT